MQVSAIITSHANPAALRAMISQLQNQVLPPCEIIAIVSDTEVHPDILEDAIVPVDLIIQSNLNDWGQQKRAEGVELAKGDYLAFFNDDDTYSSKYLSTMLEYANKYPDTDIVACDFISKYAPDQVAITGPAIGYITSGNFIVRTSLAQRVGYNHRHYEADGQFIEDCMAAGAKFIRVPQVLYIHE